MKGFYSIWLEEVDSRRYALIRIGFSILLLFHFLWLLPYSDSLLTNEGISTSEMSAIGFNELTGGKSISIFKVFRKILNESVRKCKRIHRHETHTKRRVNICTLDQYKLEPKRMVNFLGMRNERCQHERFF